MNFFIQKELADLLLFHGLQIEHVGGHQIEQNLGIMLFQNKGRDNPDHNKGEGHQRKVSGMEQGL